jgi:hypothetical protein
VFAYGTPRDDRASAATAVGKPTCRAIEEIKAAAPEIVVAQTAAREQKLSM